jgi:hypothetical protein
MPHHFRKLAGALAAVALAAGLALAGAGAARADVVPPTGSGPRSSTPISTPAG